MCVLQTRTNFEETSKQTESLMKKMMEVRQMVSRERYSFLKNRDGAVAVHICVPTIVFYIKVSYYNVFSIVLKIH